MSKLERRLAIARLVLGIAEVALMLTILVLVIIEFYIV